MNSTASSSGWPTRDTALLMAEPRPALRTGTERHEGRRERRHHERDADAEQEQRRAARRRRRRAGGSRSARRRGPAARAGSWPGCARATAGRGAMSSGPTTRNGRGPMRPATVPTRVETEASAGCPRAGPTAAAASGRVAQHALEEQALEERRGVERAVDQERGEVDDRELADRGTAPGGTSGSRRVTMRIGNATAATMPMASTTNAVGSVHCCSWPRMSPKLMPPTATAMTSEPSQSRRRGASSLRDSGTWRSAAYSASEHQRHVDQERDAPATASPR